MMMTTKTMPKKVDAAMRPATSMRQRLGSWYYQRKLKTGLAYRRLSDRNWTPVEQAAAKLLALETIM